MNMLLGRIVILLYFVISSTSNSICVSYVYPLAYYLYAGSGKFEIVSSNNAIYSHSRG